MLATLSSYIKTHEKLLICVLGIILIWAVSSKIGQIISDHDQANFTAEKATLAAQIDKNSALAQQVADQATAYKLLADKVSFQNSALEQANVALATALTRQQKTDATLPLPELAARFTQLIPEAKPIAVPGGLQIDESGAHATVAALEQVPILTSQLANSQNETKNVNSLLLASTAQVTTLNDRVSGLILQQVKSDKVCAAQIKVVKDDARKSKRRWFLAGIAVGIGTRILFKF